MVLSSIESEQLHKEIPVLLLRCGLTFAMHTLDAVFDDCIGYGRKVSVSRQASAAYSA